MKSQELYTIMAEKISTESACTYDNALTILDSTKPSIKQIAYVKLFIIYLANIGAPQQMIFDACNGITKKCKCHS